LDEKMKHEFKITKSKEQTVYTLESATGGSTSAGSIASMDSTLGGMQRRNPPGDNILAQEKKETPKPRNFVAKNAKMGGAGQHKDKKKAEKQGDVKHKNKDMAEGKDDKIAQLKKDHDTAVHWSKNETSPQKREAARQKAEKIKRHLDTQYKQGVAEGFPKDPNAPKLVRDRKTGKQYDPNKEFEKKMNSPEVMAQMKRMAQKEGFDGEYDDEAGMAHSNLLTTARAVIGLLKTIKDRDNLPEWGQEKIAKAEMMLVSVWDYLQSQKAMGNDPQQGVAEGDTYMESLQDMLERSVSQAQHNLMVGVAHNPQFAQKVKVKQKVGQEFAKADTGHDISKLPMRVPKKK
jgi:hypothetical protein